jgi:hypothetical protein
MVLQLPMISENRPRARGTQVPEKSHTSTGISVQGFDRSPNIYLITRTRSRTSLQVFDLFDLQGGTTNMLKIVYDSVAASLLVLEFKFKAKITQHFSASCNVVASRRYIPGITRRYRIWKRLRKKCIAVGIGGREYELSGLRFSR